MRWLVAAGLVFFSTWTGGCDLVQVDRADRDGPQLRLLLGPLHFVEMNGLSERCASSIQTAMLTVNGQEIRQDVTGDTVVFDVGGLRRGNVRARAAILSNTGDTLFVGEDRRTIDVADFGTVDIALEKLRPVLQVCPDTLTLSRAENFSGTLLVINRGARPTGTQADTLTWSTDVPRVCVDGSCVLFEPDSGTAIVPLPETVFVWSIEPMPGASFDVPFQSPYGWAVINVRIGEE